jgi:glycosyltransferase involved in cell wall biosynthesis
MNIYWITKISEKRFYSTSRVELAKALRERGHTVTLVIERNIGEKQGDDKNLIRLPTLPYRFISRLLFGLNILFIFPFMIRKEKIDVILIDGANIWSPFALSLKLFRIPLILDIRTLSTDKEKSLETVYYDTSLIFSKFITKGLTTITPELKDILIKKYHLEKEKIGVWTSGVSKELLLKPVDQQRKINIQIDSSCLYLMYHGTYEATRGIETLIESLVDLKAPIKAKIRLLIVGVHEHKKKDFLGLIHKLGLDNNILLISPVDHNDINLYIDICDVGVIPLPPTYIWWWVSAPMKTLEYLSRGKPIIATDIPYHHRIFDKGNCGLLIPSGDKKTLTEAITKIYNEKDMLKEMGKVGREIALKYFTWDQSAIALEAFIKNTLMAKIK